ncbi:MAG: N-acetylglucosamine-6-phosphate deacetylase [Chloroflexi bacterium]|nr:N-acetylglucosamine-6-phosphate deacetylase [Chloroflexota bacterium]
MTTSIHSLICGEILTPQSKLAHHIISISEGKISALSPSLNTDQADGRGISDGVLDVRDGLVVPGLIDLQVNGALNWSFQSQDYQHFAEVVAFHLSAGTTTMLPTLITAAEDVLLAGIRTLTAALQDFAPATLPGIHIEGPFLSPQRKGAHDEHALRLPDLALAHKLVAAGGGHIRLFTLAPELPGSTPLISYLVQQGVIVAAGHSQATYKDMRQAIAAGLTFVTHAGNVSDWPYRAMGELGFMTSEPGVVGSLMAETELAGSIILDGFHFHPALLPPLLRLKGTDRLLLVSDASTAAGCPPGEYRNGGLHVIIHPAGFATAGGGGGYLAGSTITLLQAVQRAVYLSGVSLTDALAMATVGPARLLGMADHKGHIQPGADADLLVLNRDLTLRHVIAGGQLVR